MLSSSSTIRMFFISIAFQILNSSCRRRKLNDENRTLGLVVPDPDIAVMIGDDRRHDSQSQSGPGFFCRKVGFEQPGLVFSRDTAAGICNRQRNDLQLLIIV